MKTNRIFIPTLGAIFLSNMACAAMVPVSITHRLISYVSNTDITTTANDFESFNQSANANTQTTIVGPSSIVVSEQAQNGASRFTYKFTVSSNGLYQFDSTVSGVSTVADWPPPSDGYASGGWAVEVLINGINEVKQYWEDSPAPTGSKMLNRTLQLHAGDLVFVVADVDSDRSYYTSTASVKISEVPLPSTLFLFFSSLVAAPLKFLRKLTLTSN